MQLLQIRQAALTVLFAGLDRIYLWILKGDNHIVIVTLNERVNSIIIITRIIAIIY